MIDRSTNVRRALRQRQRGFIINPFRFGGGGGGGGDPYFANVISLLHFDGADGSTTFTDIKSKPWTANGNAKISTAQSKFGGAAGLFDGSGDFIVTPSSADFDFGSSAFTVEFFAYVSGLTDQVFIGRRNGGGFTPFGVGIFGGKLQMLVSTSGGGWAATSADTVNFATGAWVHVALVRIGTTVTLYKGGNSVASATVSGALMSSTDAVIIGAWGTSTYFVNGWIDEFRITKGVARYTSSFTPPSAAFPNS